MKISFERKCIHQRKIKNILKRVSWKCRDAIHQFKNNIKMIQKKKPKKRRKKKIKAQSSFAEFIDNISSFFQFLKFQILNHIKIKSVVKDFPSRTCSFANIQLNAPIQTPNTLDRKKDVVFQVFLQLNTGEIKTIEIPNGRLTSVIYLKEIIKQVTGIPGDEQKITFGGKYLRDNLILGDYNIQNGSTLNLMDVLIGGNKVLFLDAKQKR